VIGPGKYDDLADMLLGMTAAEGLLLVVLDGARGNGVSCKCTPDMASHLPAALRVIADQLERDLAVLKSSS